MNRSYRKLKSRALAIVRAKRIKSVGPASAVQARKTEGARELAHKEALAALIVLAVACLLSAVADAPLEGPADPGAIPSEAVKAPWIFCGIQQMLRYFSPVLAGFVLPLGAVFLVGLIPWVQRLGKAAGYSVFFAIVLALLVLTAWGYYR